MIFHATNFIGNLLASIFKVMTFIHIYYLNTGHCLVKQHCATTVIAESAKFNRCYECIDGGSFLLLLNAPRALQEAQDIFGLDFDFEEFNQYGEDYEEALEEDSEVRGLVSSLQLVKINGFHLSQSWV